jgi:hypothetical protein
VISIQKNGVMNWDNSMTLMEDKLVIEIKEKYLNIVGCTMAWRIPQKEIDQMPCPVRN